MNDSNLSWGKKKGLVYLGFYSPKKTARRILRLQHQLDRPKVWVLLNLVEEGLKHRFDKGAA